MDAKLLIDGIVQQTTILLAQVSTAAGVRAPLAHVADQVFIELAREIEAQGVRRKVAADMFGLALRTYQKRVQRLTGGPPSRHRTLWEAVYEFLSRKQRVTRAEVNQRFRYEPAEHVGAVLSDLVQQGMAFATGHGQATVYRIVESEDRAALLADGTDDALTDMVWLHVYRHGPLRRSELESAFTVGEQRLTAAIDVLSRRGRLRAQLERDPILAADTFEVQVGDKQGWEAAVFDHFSTVATALASKLRIGPRSSHNDRVGGSTHSFDVYPGHPMEEEVYDLLRTVRQQVDALWERVSRHNRAHPVHDDRKVKVSFYFGQTVSDAAEDAAGRGGEHDTQE